MQSSFPFDPWLSYRSTREFDSHLQRVLLPCGWCMQRGNCSQVLFPDVLGKSDRRVIGEFIFSCCTHKKERERGKYYLLQIFARVSFAFLFLFLFFFCFLGLYNFSYCSLLPGKMGLEIKTLCLRRCRQLTVMI